VQKFFITIFIVTMQPFLAYSSAFSTTARICYYNERDYVRAKKACLEAIKIEPNNFELYGILSGSEIGLGNWQAASAALIEAINIDSLKTLTWIDKKGGGVQYFHQAFYFSAQELFYKQNYTQVLSNLAYATLLIPDDIGTQILSGVTLYKLGNFDEANKEFRRVLDRDPENPDVLFLIGKSLFEAKNYDASLSYFANAEKYYDLRYARIAQMIFQNRAEIDKALAQRIIMLWAGKKMNELDSLLKEDLKFDKGLDVHKVNIEQYYKTAIDLARNLYFNGMAYYYLHGDSLALNKLRQSLELTPGDLDALFFTGELLTKFKNYHEARGYFEKLTQLKADDLNAWFYLGVCYTQLKEYNKAVDVYENKVLPLDPENIGALTNLTYVYNELGNKEKVIKYSEQLEKIKKEK